jgi:hypothetical protein
MVQLQGKADRVALVGTVDKSGATGPDLTDYPRLTCAPLQWGDGVRTANNGTSVDMLGRAAFAAHVIDALDAIAGEYGVTLAELLDALRYARDHGTV